MLLSKQLNQLHPGLLTLRCLGPSAIFLLVLISQPYPQHDRQRCARRQDAEHEHGCAFGRGQADTVQGFFGGASELSPQAAQAVALAAAAAAGGAVQVTHGSQRC